MCDAAHGLGRNSLETLEQPVERLLRLVHSPHLKQGLYPHVFELRVVQREQTFGHRRRVLAGLYAAHEDGVHGAAALQRRQRNR